MAFLLMPVEAHRYWLCKHAMPAGRPDAAPGTMFKSTELREIPICHSRLRGNDAYKIGDCAAKSISRLLHKRLR